MTQQDLKDENHKLKKLLSDALELLQDCRPSHGLFINQEYWKLKERFEKLNHNNTKK